MKGGKKPAAMGSKGKGKKSPKERPANKRAKKNSAESKDKEDSKEKDKKSNDPCNLVTPESIQLVIPPVMDRVGLRPVWTLLFPLFP